MIREKKINGNGEQKKCIKKNKKNIRSKKTPEISGVFFVFLIGFRKIRKF